MKSRQSAQSIFHFVPFFGASKCTVVLVGLFIFFFPLPAYAYLDPGTGSMLVSALIGITATAFFMLKSFFYKTSGVFYRLTGGTAASRDKNSLVFYSEGKQYWNTFKPVLEALDAKGEKAIYLTSDKNDPAFNQAFSGITTRFIGEGNRAFAAMNMLEASVCVMTTPGLDVLQIRKSPGVKHYSHLVHSPTDVALYRLFSFDYFDSVLCSGMHQIRSLRALEALRGTKEKLLLHTGCPYMDVLANDIEQVRSCHKRVDDKEKTCILFAPTWGENGLLRRFGLDLLIPMAEAGFRLIIRPHPQSALAEPDTLSLLQEKLLVYPNVQWDNEVNPVKSMLASDVLVSDFSGIIFDYAFILERPVITIDAPMDTRGMDAGDLPYPAWELEQLPKLGASIMPAMVKDLPRIIAGLPEQKEFAQTVEKLRLESLYNYRKSGIVAAEQILALLATPSTNTI